MDGISMRMATARLKSELAPEEDRLGPRCPPDNRAATRPATPRRTSRRFTAKPPSLGGSIASQSSRHGRGPAVWAPYLRHAARAGPKPGSPGRFIPVTAHGLLPAQGTGSIASHRGTKHPSLTPR